MRTVLKYTLTGPDVTVEMPFLSFFLHAKLKPNGNAEVWYDVNDDSELMWRRFKTIGTGREVPLDGTHIATLVEPGDLIDYVWHIFEVRL